ncbi:plasmid partitioning protein RepB C-terminal domain-containing protein [Agrobacterium pusense]|uniref:plasmid partitioning protein RepB C-terminal domain-containing protein n=1 Tax=Agrobacterium pusense TaxID=648995 RepID=UPI0024153AD2|nr:plasmid partitioning protein RepB C-terminal domain-containing protein [Agrobacterium pusense]WFN88394.1 plasmid partitioning protein RepB C-terminal domain-containing protein [Agrobacterium pusense]
MTKAKTDEAWKYIDIIPIDRIRVLNPRERDQRKFRLLIENISKVGLKRPITVSKKSIDEHEANYDLVCGQGRIEAFVALGQAHIPAMVIEASKNDCLVMSLVENCARRQHRAIDLLQEIANLRQRGYNDKEIGAKIGFTPEYVSMIGGLLEKGEERLLSAVEAGILPLSLAVDIAKADEEGAQAALMEAYTQKKLRGKKLVTVRRLLQQRSLKGARLFDQNFGRYNAPKRTLTSEAMVRAYQQEADRQKVLIKKAEVTQGKLLFVVEAMRSLMSEEGFMNLLKAEGLDAVPAPLRHRLVKG